MVRLGKVGDPTSANFDRQTEAWTSARLAVVVL